MRKIVRIVSEEEYNTWLTTQSSWYQSTIRNTDADPFKGLPLPSDAPEDTQAPDEKSADTSVIEEPISE